MQMNVVLEKNAYMPEKAHSVDAGFDLRSREDVIIPAGNCHTFDTGVRMAIPAGYVGFLKSKSGLNVKYGVIEEGGVIDCGYTGSICVKLYNQSKADYHVNIGDKITQIVILPIPEVDLVQVNSLENTERGEGGFGSTGK